MYPIISSCLRLVSRPQFSVFAGLALLSITGLSAGELKVDINRDSKNSLNETQLGYTRWSADSTGGAASGLNAVTKNFTTATGEAVTVTFAQTATSQSRGGTGLLSNWYQAGAQGTAKLVSDGITVAPANLATGGELKMTITGLSAGHHTLLTYHNAWDSPVALVSLAPIDVSVNGSRATASQQPTIRAATNADASVAFLEFDVTEPASVTTILFSAQTNSSAAVKNVMINGFEIDTPNSTRTAASPSPADGDEHVDADSGSITLSWGPAASGKAVSHDLYIGTDKAAVTLATRVSSEFKGTQGTLSYPLTGLNSHLTYYWRVDEIDDLGNITKGNIWAFRPRQLAFPGAEGYGRFARGGRDGIVVHVTSLEDYAPDETPIVGTLRYAIEQATGPRTIVFDISGLITLSSRLTVSSPYLTIAGQTAPGKGVTVRNFTMGLSGAKDVIVRFFRSRPGNISGTTIDGMGMQGSDHSIMDHCSISWSIDEAFSSRSAKNITLQRTLISEALNAAGHKNYPPGTQHGYAASIGGDRGSFHHNLLAHCYGRNWSLAGGLDPLGFFAGRLDITNNVVYNWGHRTTDGGAMEVNFVNNYYKPGAGSDYFYALNAQYDAFPGTQRYFFSGNVMPGHFDETNQSAGRTMTASSGSTLPSYPNFLDTPFFPSYVSTQTAGEAYKRVLSDVGCNQPALDEHDDRIVTETLNGTYSYVGSVTGKPGFPDTQADVGGWENYPVVLREASFDSDGDGLPDWWEKIKGLSPRSPAGDFSDSNADADGDGFTNLDDYLAWIAAPHVECQSGSAADVDISRLTRGYNSGVVYTLGTVANGSAQLMNDGKTVRFTPAAGFAGLGSFTFTVTDSSGSSLTRTVGVRVATDDTPRFSLNGQAGSYSASFYGSSGCLYDLQYSTDLIHWTTWLTLAGTGSVQSVSIPNSLLNGPRDFFRAILKED